MYPAEHPKMSENHRSSGTPFFWQYLSALPLMGGHERLTRRVVTAALEEYKKNYSPREEQIRRSIWEKNIEYGECNSCWAFSTAGALEGQLKMKTGKLDVLSPEQLVDCVYGYGCSQGGNPIEAYNYIMQVGGLEKESDYPYNVNSAHTCKFDKSKALGKIQKVVVIPQGDEEALKEAVATVGPLSICVAANENFKHYKNGVFKKKCGRKINHAVMLVGYGEEDGVGFWLIKNRSADFADHGTMIQAHFDAAPPYPWSGTEVHQLGQLNSGFLKRECPSWLQHQVYQNKT
ncbi:CTSK [Cordylochernes scorpioides]|uniref:CTSK n=1 Tax=Cordylochernes scorpioides TaxID=51811 RepID=A0ABY6KZ14_9ARAC|nr:CTSK [Cordylochernes scorpioides]